jgi:PilZ domain-containing protein
VYCVTVPGFKQPPKPTSLDPGPKGAERIACGERCEFEVAGSSTPREGIIWNLSVAGLYLVVQADVPPVDAAVKVCLWLPGDPRPVRAETQVVWCNPPSPFSGCGANAPRFPPGCGLRFVDIPAADLARIQSRVESVHPNRADPQRDPRQR